MGKNECSDLFNKFYEVKCTNNDQAKMELKRLQRIGSGEVFFEGDEKYAMPLWNLHLSQCYVCTKNSIWRGEELIYPAYKLEIKAHHSMPQEIKEDFCEASQICLISPRGSAALARLCIQKLCKILGGHGEKIDSDIALLVKNGLNSKYQKMLDSVRVIGNECVHPGKLDFRDDHDTAKMLLSIINLLVEELIEQPQKLEALYQKLPEGKRLAIEKRDKKE